VSVCPKKCPDVFCRDCLDRQFTMKVEESYGACPLLRCPGASCGAFLKFDAWKGYVKPSVEERYNQNAQALLSLQCASCHTRGTLLAHQDPITEDKREERMADISKSLTEKGANKAQLTRFKALLEDYVSGNDSPKSFLDNFVSCVGADLRDSQTRLDQALTNVDQLILRKNGKERAELAALNEKKLDLQAKQAALETKLAAETEDVGRRRTQYGLDNLLIQVAANAEDITNMDLKYSRFRAAYMKKENVEELRAAVSSAREKTATHVQPLIPAILSVINDIQRRAFLQLRFVLMFPTVNTICCNRTHCFKCHTTQHAPGVSCQEVWAGTTLEIRQCPQCNMSITKGDGCSSVRCVCGHGFSWGEGKLVS